MIASEVADKVAALAQAHDEACEREMRLVENLVIIAAELGAPANYDAVIARIKQLRALERNVIGQQMPQGLSPSNGG